MTPTAARKRHAALNRMLYFHAHLYYCDPDNAELSDAVFDSLRHELLRIECEHPELRTQHSYSQIVGCPHIAHRESTFAPPEWSSLPDTLIS
jgi:NAD-dependent DNA ligase